MEVRMKLLLLEQKLPLTEATNRTGHHSLRVIDASHTMGLHILIW